MKRKKSYKNAMLMAGAALILMAGAAGAASYITRSSMETAQVTKKAPVARSAVQVASAAPAQPRCDDDNILGLAAGGVAGGVVGHQIGKGTANTAATIGGALSGAYLGKKFIPLDGSTCRQ